MIGQHEKVHDIEKVAARRLKNIGSEYGIILVDQDDFDYSTGRKDGGTANHQAVIFRTHGQTAQLNF